MPYLKANRESLSLSTNFNYQIQEVVAQKDTINFESFDYKFTFCRANNNWIIETKQKEESSGNLFSETQKAIAINGKQYEYGVKIETQSSGKREQAIFELSTVESSQVKQQVLYDLEEVKQARSGVELAEPEISSPIIYDNRLFWYIFAYRGEGFGGIATIVSYDPVEDQIVVIKPPEIATQIINDLTISGNPNNPTFWIATQLTGEGNPYIPGMGLVAYRPRSLDYTQGEITNYQVNNSPIVGAIPTKLFLEDDILWIGTGNGICRVEWQTVRDRSSWNCWRFAVMAELPTTEIPIYSSLLDTTVETTLQADTENETIEVLWWLAKQYEPFQGRYEIEYQGREVEFNNGASTWEEWYGYQPQSRDLQSPLYWAGNSWHWNGTRFIRGLDEVELNLVGGGALGIRSGEPNQNYIFNTKAIRGDLELLELTKERTKLKYYSAWVEDSFLKPYIEIVPHSNNLSDRPNPLLEIKSQL